VIGEGWAARGGPKRVRGSVAGLAICCAAALFAAGYFVLAEGPTTASNIAHNHERVQQTRLALSRFDPASTVLVMGAEWVGPFRAAGYLLPEFHSYALLEREDEEARWAYSADDGKSDYSLPYPAGTKHLRLPSGIENVLVLDDETAQRAVVRQPLERIPLGALGTIYRLPAARGEIRALDIVDGKVVPAYDDKASAPATSGQRR
jgi:hypothetical protein